MGETRAGGKAEKAAIDERIAAVARDEFGWETLRPGQLVAVRAVVQGHDALAVMPTGYGKSAIYQLAGHLLDGPTVVVSPLISLQADQVRSIRSRTGDGREAVAVNSGRSKRANDEAWVWVANGSAEFVFLAPEQLARDEVVERLRDLGVSLFVVDEAHCVTSWGRDFRPAYLRLGAVIRRLGGPRILALTATGSAPVRDEIVQRLGLREPEVFVHGFDRPNIRLAVERHESEHEKERAVLEQVTRLAPPGLVYLATRGDTERVADALGATGLRAAAYHGGLGARERAEVHELFQAGGLDVVVATSAFGMGIDKPDVRFVVHGDVTESLDSYYQELGRAGRDGEPALATLHYRPEDLGLRRFFAGGRVSEERVGDVVEALLAGGGGVDGSAVRSVSDLVEATGLPDRAVENIVNLLVETGLLAEEGEGVVLASAVTPEQAFDAVTSARERQERIDTSRIVLMQGYAETRGCRRQFLLGYFGDDLAAPCGNCDVCTRRGWGPGGTDARPGLRGDGAAGVADASVPTPEAGGLPEAGAPTAPPYAEGDDVIHVAWGPGEIVSLDGDRLTAYFPAQGYKVLSLDAVLTRDLLRPAAPE
ncbi:ATP-dependent DNA helicase RecQ [Herbiconiux sp. A18JL235]|uniref:ATP-dependent DNA helicase RecQ n=1 Tax=Herbiconiux sp. A18JL235 TaxID=3152363 RepID=A0AB39BJG0_9MICO